MSPFGGVTLPPSGVSCQVVLSMGLGREHATQVVAVPAAGFGIPTFDEPLRERLLFHDVLVPVVALGRGVPRIVFIHTGRGRI